MIALLAQLAFGCFAVYGMSRTAHFGWGFWRVWDLERELDRWEAENVAWAEWRLDRWEANWLAANALIDEVTASIHETQKESA